MGSGDVVDEGGGDIGAVFFGSALTRMIFFFGGSFSVDVSFWIGLAILIRSNGVDCVGFSSGVESFSSGNDTYNRKAVSAKKGKSTH